MNKLQMKGISIYIAGNLEERAGKILRNSRRRVKGYQRKMTGMALMSLGDAQAAIDGCLNGFCVETEEQYAAPSRDRRHTKQT